MDYPYHVLIVEDNKTNQFIARTILEQAGFKVSLTDIKGSSGNIGAKRLFTVASELQKVLVTKDEVEIHRLHEQFRITYSELFDEITLKISS